MNAAHFRLTYDGLALANAEMDVRELAPALLSAADLLKAVNHALYGDQVEVRVNVRGSFKTGSFGIDLTLIQDFLRNMRDLFAGQDGSAVANAVEILAAVGFVKGGGGLIGLLKKLRGRTVDAVEDDEGRKALLVQDERIRVENHVYVLFQDRPTREHLSGILNPLDEEGIDKLAFGTDDAIDGVIERAERGWFEAPAPNETPLYENTNRIVLLIESPTFKEGNKWRFSDGTTSFWGEIKDEEFLAKVNSGTERFGKGDQLVVDLSRAQFETEGRLRTDYTITKVVEHREHPQRKLI